jgi:hypothetical protein
MEKKGNTTAPDGYQYGVMFSDGSVAMRWTGSTQRARAQEYADKAAEAYPDYEIGLVRRKPGKNWELV